MMHIGQIKLPLRLFTADADVSGAFFTAGRSLPLYLIDISCNSNVILSHTAIPARKHGIPSALP